MFMCFSSGDRYTVAKSCLYHLKNFGINVWYDYHELILGDGKKEKNFEYAIKNNQYFLILYSNNLFKSPCAIKEEKRIFNELNTRNITIFPLLYNIKFTELPISYQNKLENYIYNEVDDTKGTLSSINQIVTKILIDKINKTMYDKTPTLSNYSKKNLSDDYIKQLLDTYNHISDENFNARITMLFAIYYYIKCNYGIDQKINYVYKIIEYLFAFTKLNIEHNHKELIIAELSMIILLDTIF